MPRTAQNSLSCMQNSHENNVNSNSTDELNSLPTNACVGHNRMLKDMNKSICRMLCKYKIVDTKINKAQHLHILVY